MDFRAFAGLVHARTNTILASSEVFHVDASRDDLWAAYVAAFPPGTNPIFRQRAEHDCATCRQFIKGVGGVVALDDNGDYQTIWDVEGAEGPYAIVAAKMAEFVRCGSVDRVYRSRERGYGVASNLEKVEGGSSITWHHFHTVLPSRLTVQNVGEVQGELAATRQVLGRGLEELTLAALETVEDLIASNSLYRGEEHRQAVQGFAALKRQYDSLPKERRSAFVWSNLDKHGAKFRNTAIGTLVQDLSEGMEVAQAVGRFESKVAPENYKRTSAPITAVMVAKAVETLKELGLEDAVRRRHAVIGDVSPSDVLFVDRGVQPLMRDGLTDLLMGAVKPGKNTVAKGGLDVGAQEFFDAILPGASEVKLHFERRHLVNLVSLTAPQHGSTGRLFQWDNDFAWVYVGNMADSAMRQAVQAAGGRVDGVFRFTHSWNHEGARNGSLMDLHVFMPGSGVGPGNAVNDAYGNNQRVGWNHRNHFSSGGTQDVDYTAIAPEGYIPVENITFPDLRRMPEGRYVCKIHNWSLRQPTKGGFRAEIEFDGQLFEYEYSKSMGNKEWVTVAEVTLKDGTFSIKHHLEPRAREVERWGLKTGVLVPVDTIMLSPNHWGGRGVGNRHHIFILRDCRNPDRVRGFFNEYLRSDLHPHRKVFEVLASKLQIDPSPDQLSGVGFSSTRHDRATFTVQKDGSTRAYNVQF